jgi:hypothetical protein
MVSSILRLFHQQENAMRLTAATEATHPTIRQIAREAIESFAALGFNDEAQADELQIDGNPFRRPTRAKDLPFIPLGNPLPLDQLASNSALALNRLLLNIYEADQLFLPGGGGESDWAGFDAFYGAEAIARGERARPHLERILFAALDAEIDIGGTWQEATLGAYFADFLAAERRQAAAPVEADQVLAAILAAADPAAAARHYLVQMAPDFLSEASAMARLAPGAYGPLQSALFNVLIDEYGAAVHRAKHSTLFEATLASLGLDPRPHCYWQFYQPSALMLTNYFHYIARNKAHFFRYLGALFYTESTLVNVTARQSALLQRVFGNRVDTRYFDEHHHIDRHHSEMVLHRLIEPAIAAYGRRAIEGVLRGFEELRLLQRLADADLADQLLWAGRLTPNAPDVAAHVARWRAAQAAESSATLPPDTFPSDAFPCETFHEVLDERSTTHIHPDDRLLVLETGEMDFFPLCGVTLQLRAGDCLFIPGGRLHGSIVRSQRSTYHQPILAPADAAPLWHRNGMRQ